jgi:hypothetical protein
MIQKLSVFALFCVMAAASLESVPLRRPAGEESCSEDHTKWVAEALERMETIKPGMTRQDLLGVFTTEGGLSTGLRRTYVSKDCPYWKVDVEFEAVGRAARDGDGGVTLVEDSRDRIKKISMPYLQFSTTD